LLQFFTHEISCTPFASMEDGLSIFVQSIWMIYSIQPQLYFNSKGARRPAPQEGFVHYS
jgi:hypothetical protein